ncbi:DUF1840 domain-containing protein [Uliginosibacterium sp. sgz301328]|uniref:DUF1840 domain-containing protein n=1 Tax=Uliginosibacterium sp. sgz301328 TaxID=3243764 RepID=UPI00359EF995
MLITFKSRAAGDVIMFGKVAERMLDAMGKDPNDRRGIVTVEQLPAAIAGLRAAVEEDRRANPPETDEDDDDEDKPRGMAAAVSFSQRAAPLLDLLGYAQRDSEPVIWEG